MQVRSGFARSPRPAPLQRGLDAARHTVPGFATSVGGLRAITGRTEAAIVAAVDAHDHHSAAAAASTAIEVSEDDLGETVVAIVLAATYSDRMMLRDAGRVDLQRAMVRNLTDRARQTAARLLHSALSAQLAEDEGGLLTAFAARLLCKGVRSSEGYDPANIVLNVFVAALQFLPLSDLLACAASCRLLMRLAPKQVRSVRLLQGGAPDAGPETLRRVATRFVHLRDVHLGELGSTVTDASVDVLAELCPELKRVTFAESDSRCHITDTAIAGLAVRCIKLVEVDLRECALLGDASALALADHCPGLTSVAFGPLGDDDDYDDYDEQECLVSDAGLDALTLRCPELTQLEVRHCANVTGAGFTSPAFSLERRPKLERVVFNSCENLTEDALTSLVTTCAPTLTEIDLEGCTQFARAETLLTTIAARCRNLEVLNMSRCGVTTLPDAMCGRLTALKELNLEDSELIRPQSDIVERWLRELKSRGCEVSLPEWEVDRS